MEQLRRVLQIRIDDQDAVTTGKLKARGKGQLMTVVARQIDGNNVWIGGCELSHNRPSSVPRAVVYQDYLVLLTNLAATG